MLTVTGTERTVFIALIAKLKTQLHEPFEHFRTRSKFTYQPYSPSCERMMAA